jgi:quercetin dioxygenase-like cupin family protein
MFFSQSGTPLERPEDVIPLLADPGHWRKGRSAYEAAFSWFDAGDVPEAIRRVIETDPAFSNATPSRVVFEQRTKLDNFGKASQTDVLALLKTPAGRVLLSIEAKFDEPFGPLVDDWDDRSDGRTGRLTGLLGHLRLTRASVGSLRYQLLHRTVAALLEAQREGIADAALVVQSFNGACAGFGDFRAFVRELGVTLDEPGRLSAPIERSGIRVRFGWAEDNPRARRTEAPQPDQLQSQGQEMSHADGGHPLPTEATANRVRLAESADEKRVPYRHPQPKESPPEIVIPDALPTDERLWVPQAENVWFRPLCLSASRGYWQNLLRVRKSGVLSRHRHPQPVHGFVLKGSWHYLEHDWVATEGAYVYEAPGETHTLVVEEDVPEMITLFQVNGCMIYVDPDGGVLGYEDAFTKINMCRRHFEAVGLGADYVERFIR